MGEKSAKMNKAVIAQTGFPLLLLLQPPGRDSCWRTTACIQLSSSVLSSCHSCQFRPLWPCRPPTSEILHLGSSLTWPRGLSNNEWMASIITSPSITSIFRLPSTIPPCVVIAMYKVNRLYLNHSPLSFSCCICVERKKYFFCLASPSGFN